MKALFAILCAMSLCAASEEGVVAEELPLNAEDAQEVAALDYRFAIQPPALPENIQPPVPIPHKSAFLAVGLSYLFPGLGHTYLGDMKTAGRLMGSYCLNGGLLFIPDMPQSTLVAGLITLQSIWSYGVYAVYRDVRSYNGESGYSYKMPADGFTDLVSAPFKWSVLKKPEVWGGFLGALALAVGAGYFIYHSEAQVLELPLETPAPLLAFPVGVGEESFFRGYLQSQFSEYFSPWGGIAISSLLFGASHIPNALLLSPESRWRYYTFSLPLITGMGAYFGWITYKNRSLKESTALHTWYDFALLTAGYLASRAAIINIPRFAVAIPYSF